MGYDRWGQTAPGYDIPLQDSAEHEALRAQLGLTVASAPPSFHVRVEGHPGVGKGRQVYEALSVRGLAERVLYANGPDDLNGIQLFGYLASRPHTSAILVINRCSAAEFAAVAPRAAACAGLTLITIGGPSQPGAPGLERAAVFAVPALATQTLQAVVQAAAPALHPQATAFIAYQTGDNAALGVRLARALETAGAVTVSAAAAAQTVGGWLRTLVPLPEEQRVAEVLSVLQQVGYRGVVENEGRTLAAFFGLAWDEMQRAAERLQERGVLRTQGRYWAMEPPLLAVHLAATVWKRRGRDMLDLVGRLPSPLAQRMFWARFADLGEDPLVSAIALRLLHGPEPLCRTLDDLDEQATMLRLFASVAPAAVLEVLERLFADSRPTPTLLRRSWHEIVWIVELLLWRPVTYDGAARLLRSMAAAEAAETTPAPARRSWRALFQTALGGTSVSALRRHELLADTLGSADEAERLLAVAGIGASLATWQVRDASYERGGTLLPPEWQPGSRADLLAVYTSALGLLDRALADTDTAVRRAATAVLLGASRDLFREGLADHALDRLERAARELHNTDPSVEEARLKIRELVEALQLGPTAPSDAHVRRLQRLHNSIVGTDFASRLRYWVGRRTVGQVRAPQEDPAPNALAELAREATTSPSLLEPERAWLYSDEAFHAGKFALRLGESDRDGRWQVPLMQSARTGQGSGFLALYLLGALGTDRGSSLREVPRSLGARGPRSRRTVREATVRGHQSDEGALRLLDLVDRGWLPVADLADLIGVLGRPTSASQSQRRCWDDSATPRATGVPRRRCGVRARRSRPPPGDWETLRPLGAAAPGAASWRRRRPDHVSVEPGGDRLRTGRTGGDRTRDHLRPGGTRHEDDGTGRGAARTPGPACPGGTRRRVARPGPATRGSRLGALSRSAGADGRAGGLPCQPATRLGSRRVPAPRGPAGAGCPIGGPRVAGLARALLLRFGAENGLGDALAPHRRAASFYGDYATVLGEHLHHAEASAADPEPSIARWARGIAQSIRVEMAHLDDG